MNQLEFFEEILFICNSLHVSRSVDSRKFPFIQWCFNLFFETNKCSGSVNWYSPPGYSSGAKLTKATPW